MKQILTGLDLVAGGATDSLTRLNLGLLANQASLDCFLNHAADIISKKLPGRLKALFGPQHGFGGHDQDNMIETAHYHDKRLDIPVLSLYAGAREPLDWMLEGIDAVVVDLQDVGTRVYTFAATMLGCMRSAARLGKKIIILDRPNPLGGEVMEGNILSPDLISFVGPCSMPMRHGLTMGEMALLFNKALGIGCDLHVVPMRGWSRSMLWNESGLRWLMPSPNMPIFETALVYPGQVIWEGTNISEGRGTCRPFEIFGAPFFDCPAIAHLLPDYALEGCALQPYVFRPTFNKWAGEICKGFMIHVTDPCAYSPYRTSLCLLQAVMRLHGEHFRFKSPPYEYEFEKRPIDLILGASNLTGELERGAGVMETADTWKKALDEFSSMRKEFLLY